MKSGLNLASAFLLVLVAGRAASAQTPDSASTVRLIAITYEDGRTTKEPLRDGSWTEWTPAFPRIEGTRVAEQGLALTALQFEYAPDGPDLAVTVALLYGTPHQKRVPVVTVRVANEDSVRIDDLQAFGVEPITIALVSSQRPQLPLPTVISPSSQLEMSADVPATGVPRYEITITNRGAQSVMALAFEAYEGTRKEITGLPHAPGYAPLIRPGESYVLKLNTSPAVASTDLGERWRSFDRIVLTSVTWSDGIVEGSERPAIESQIANAAIARQLARALALIQVAQGEAMPDLARLHAAIEALPIDDPEAIAAEPAHVDRRTAVSLTQIGMQNAKEAVLNDLDAFVRDPASGAAEIRHQWLKSAFTKLSAWRSRIVAAPR